MKLGPREQIVHTDDYHRQLGEVGRVITNTISFQSNQTLPVPSLCVIAQYELVCCSSTCNLQNLQTFRNCLWWNTWYISLALPSPGVYYTLHRPIAPWSLFVLVSPKPLCVGTDRPGEKRDQSKTGRDTEGGWRGILRSEPHIKM